MAWRCSLPRCQESRHARTSLSRDVASPNISTPPHLPFLAPAGCFWGVELAYQRIPGVTKTAVGYTQVRFPHRHTLFYFPPPLSLTSCTAHHPFRGLSVRPLPLPTTPQGKDVNPSYEAVCSGKTGHTEAVLVEYDPVRSVWDTRDSSHGGAAFRLECHCESASALRCCFVLALAESSPLLIHPRPGPPLLQAVCKYETLVELLWTRIDPTQVNGQGNDWGTQVRPLDTRERAVCDLKQIQKWQ